MVKYIIRVGRAFISQVGPVFQPIPIDLKIGAGSFAGGIDLLPLSLLDQPGGHTGKPKGRHGEDQQQPVESTRVL